MCEKDGGVIISVLALNQICSGLRDLGVPDDKIEKARELTIRSGSFATLLELARGY